MQKKKCEYNDCCMLASSPIFVPTAQSSADFVKFFF